MALVAAAPTANPASVTIARTMPESVIQPSIARKRPADGGLTSSTCAFGNLTIGSRAGFGLTPAKSRSCRCVAQ